MMKKIAYYMAIVAIATLAAACDPSIIEGPEAGVITADQLNAMSTITPVVENGKVTNKVVCRSTASANCSWNNGVTDYRGNELEMLMFAKGKQTITLTAMSQDGSKLTKEFTVNVEEMAYDVPKEYALFCGDGQKVWTWQSENCFGNGGASESGPAWWILHPADVTQQCKDKNLPADGAGATLTFTLQGLKLKHTSADGATVNGTFDFSMSNVSEPSGIGKLSLSGVNVLCGYDFNGDLMPWSEYHIVSLTEDKMVLGVKEWTAGNYWYYVFVPRK